MRRILAALSLTALSLTFAASTASAQPFSNELTPAQVACNETQLRNLLQRMSLRSFNNQQTNNSLTLLVSYSNPFGFFEGLAVSNQTPLVANTAGGVSAESFLAFSINPSIRTTLLNPARQPLEQVTLVREDTGSNLVGTTSPNALSLSLNPTLGANPTTGQLQINNIGQTSAAQCAQQQVADIKPGRGLTLAGLTTACHNLFTDFDRFMFEVLQRTIRVQAPGNAAQDFEVAIYRGEQEETYRIDVYPVDANGQGNNGKVALELAVGTNSSGHVTDGSLRVLPVCGAGQTSNCTNANSAVTVFLVPPVFGGTEVRLATDVVGQLTYTPGGAIPAAVPVNFVQVFQGTPWND